MATVSLLHWVHSVAEFWRSPDADACAGCSNYHEAEGVCVVLCGDTIPTLNRCNGVDGLPAPELNGYPRAGLGDE